MSMSSTLLGSGMRCLFLDGTRSLVLTLISITTNLIINIFLIMIIITVTIVLVLAVQVPLQAELVNSQQLFIDHISRLDLGYFYSQVGEPGL